MTELVIEDLVIGDGTEVKKGGALITAHYRGSLEDGTEFDSSYSRGEPFQTVLSRNKVIVAWVEGLKGCALVVNESSGYLQRWVMASVASPI